MVFCYPITYPELRVISSYKNSLGVSPGVPPTSGEPGEFDFDGCTATLFRAILLLRRKSYDYTQRICI